MSLDLREINADGTERYAKVVITGDGRMQRSHVNENLVHTTANLRTVEEVEMARLLLDQVRDIVK